MNNSHAACSALGNAEFVSIQAPSPIQNEYSTSILPPVAHIEIYFNDVCRTHKSFGNGLPEAFALHEARRTGNTQRTEHLSVGSLYWCPNRTKSLDLFFIVAGVSSLTDLL